ncbi:MAG: DsbA family protein [Bifidobacteriaceae bacterium]|jgi:protein-disulfide isomerase|nr:DsbA family protein [Bifidobacteriaceae bacterium]
MIEPTVQRPSGSLGTWIAVVGAVATAALGMSIAALVVGLNTDDEASTLNVGDQPADTSAVNNDDPVAETASERPSEEAPPQGDPLVLVGVPVGQGGAAVSEIPTEPPVRIDTFFDFMCPYCAQFEEAYGAQLQSMVDSGQIAWVQHPIGFLDRFSMGTNYSSRAAAAAYVVANAAPESFSAFVQGLFAIQPAENTEGLTDDQIVEVAQGVGVPKSVAAEFWAPDYVDTQYNAAIEASNAGITGTPTVLISTPDSPPEQWDFQTPLDEAVASKAGQ